MYSEELDTIERGIEAYGNDLRHIAVKICKKIGNIGKTVTLDVSYYTDSEVNQCYFAVDGYDDYPESAYIDRVNDLNTTNPAFHLYTEATGRDLGEWTVDDFNTNDMLGVCRLLNDILNVVREDKEVH